jgi:outer membrane murein-binding lipoprotein Lpp
MKKNLKQLVLVLTALAMLVLAGCKDKKGPMQKAGEKVDQAAEATGDAVKDAVEKTGDAIKDATE